MAAIILTICTFISTMSGGLFALRFRSKMHHIMGFAAGVLVGVVAFDILPEIINRIPGSGIGPTPVMIMLVLAFLLFHIFEKTIVIHHMHEDDYAAHKHPQVGIISALALAGHSFLDGVGIGIGFQISPAVGVIVAIAVIAHDFTDGLNTVTLMLANNNSVKKARYFLLLDALTPLLGVGATFFIRFSTLFLLLYLGFFAGFLLYIGASDILPEAHSKRSSGLTIALTVAGALFIFIVTRFV